MFDLSFNITPVVAESFIIAPGERYDFIIDASQAVGNYWVRGETLDREFMKRDGVRCWYVKFAMKFSQSNTPHIFAYRIKRIWAI
jgi:hypothetical protein